MSRTQLGIWAVIAIVATRLVIGWHFYIEGRKKLSAKQWSAAGFFSQAQGPFTAHFTSLTPKKYALLDSLIADPDREKELGDEDRSEIATWRQTMRASYQQDFSDFTIEPTVAAWWHHSEKLGDYYDFQNSNKLEQDLKTARAETRKVVHALGDQRRQIARQLQKYEPLFGEDANKEKQESGKPDSTAGGEGQATDAGQADAAESGEAKTVKPADGEQDGEEPPSDDKSGKSSDEPTGDEATGDDKSGDEATDGQDPTSGAGDKAEATPAPKAPAPKTPEQEILESQRQDYERLQGDLASLDEKYLVAETRYKQLEQQILLARNQVDQANDVIDHWTAQLEDWVAENYETLREYRESMIRVEKNSKNAARQGVATLEGQSSTIESNKKKLAAPLVAGLAGIWEGFNAQLNALATPQQLKQVEFVKFEIARPDGPSTRLSFIDRVTPWFDVIVGALLILGLFTRIASLAGAGFLSMVVLSQAPWLGNASSEVFAYTSEMFALLVLAAVGAGRFAGLDFFLRCIFFSVFPPKSQEMRRYEAQRPQRAEPVEATLATEAEEAEPITV